MILSAVDAVWATIAGNEKNELAFEVEGGIAAMLLVSGVWCCVFPLFALRGRL